MGYSLETGFYRFNLFTTRTQLLLNKSTRSNLSTLIFNPNSLISCLVQYCHSSYLYDFAKRTYIHEHKGKKIHYEKENLTRRKSLKIDSHLHLSHYSKQLQNLT